MSENASNQSNIEVEKNMSSEKDIILGPQPQEVGMELEVEEDEESVEVLNEPPSKKFKNENGTEKHISPIPEDPKSLAMDSLKCDEEIPNMNGTDDEIIQPPNHHIDPPKTEELQPNPIPAQIQKNLNDLDGLFEGLIDNLQKTYLIEANKATGPICKVIDTLLYGIHCEVKERPEEVKALIQGSRLVLPNSVFFPPSLTVEMCYEHDAVISFEQFTDTKYGFKKPPLTEDEKRKNKQLKATFAAPYMTNLVAEIGDNLVKEYVYGDIVLQRNLPETPKNIEEYQKVVQQLKPLYEKMKEENKPYKFKYRKCKACGFKSESQSIFLEHQKLLHYDGRKYKCTYCPEQDDKEKKMVKHITTAHNKEIVYEAPVDKYQCGICEENFPFKGLRETHMKVCKKDKTKTFNIQKVNEKYDLNAINQCLWTKSYYSPLAEAQKQAEAEKLHQEQIKRLAEAEKVKKANTVAKAALKRTANNEAKTSQGQQNLGASAINVAMLQSLMRNPQQMAQMAALEMLSKGNPAELMKILGGAGGGEQLKMFQQLMLMNQQQKQQAAQQQQNMNAVAAFARSSGASSETILQMVRAQQVQLAAAAALQQQPSTSKATNIQETNEKQHQVWISLMEGSLKTKIIPPELKKHIDVIRGNKATMQELVTKIIHLNDKMKANPNYKMSSEDTFVQYMFAILKIMNETDEASKASKSSSTSAKLKVTTHCEICRKVFNNKLTYFTHLREDHKQLFYKEPSYMEHGPDIQCPKCDAKTFFYTYLGLERHLFESHDMVTVDLLSKAQRSIDEGYCKICKKDMKSLIVTHVASAHEVKLASLAVSFKCDFCTTTTASYINLCEHLKSAHNKTNHL
uniref:C2H2-type domain-containing protein n=1 Tax=Rhabditophanes sp. KR3021 TaxID=114890 RepID=A0AC35TX66_9BILA